MKRPLFEEAAWSVKIYFYFDICTLEGRPWLLAVPRRARTPAGRLGHDGLMTQIETCHWIIAHLNYRYTHNQAWCCHYSAMQYMYIGKRTDTVGD